jgi:signal transduction histidine kinase/ActR/RegA family two-component response regulator
MGNIGKGREPIELLRTFFDTAPEPLVLFDRERNVVYTNAAARLFVGEDVEGLPTGRRAERWTLRDEAGRLMLAAASPSARALHGEIVLDAQCELVSHDRRVHLSVDAFPLRDDAGVVDGVVCILRPHASEVERTGPRLFAGQPSWIGSAARPEGAGPRLRMLAAAGRALGTSLDYPATLETLARAAVATLADWCAIRVLEPDGRVRRLPTAYADPTLGPAARAMEEYYASHTDAAVYTPAAGIGRVLRTGEPDLIPQVSPEWLRSTAHDDAHFEILGGIGMTSLLHVPLLLRNRTIGVLTLATTKPGGRYGVGDLAVAEELSDRIAVAIENARLLEASERRGREWHAMAEVARVLAETLDPVLVWQRIAAGVRTLLDDAPAAALYYLEPTGDVRAVAESTETGVHFDWTHRLPKGAGMVGLAIRTHDVVAAEDVLVDPDVVYPPEARARLERSAYRSVLAVPLIVQGRVLGALAVGAEQGRRFTEQEIELVTAFAHHAAVACDNARLFEEAQRGRTDAEDARARAEEANRTKDEFLAILSHELRTPLTAILGWVRMLLAGRVPAARVTEALSAIDRNTRVQTRLIDDLLDVSRIVAGKMELARRPVDLTAVVSEVVASARQNQHAAAVLREPAIERDCVVVGDRERLHQVATNLIANAIKFTPADGRVEVRLGRVGPDVELVVSDTGEGISAVELSHIFSQFHQVDRSHTRRHGGLGLGLAIVRHLVENHGGSVHAVSAGLGLGSCFTVRLPSAPGTDRRATTVPRAHVDDQILNGMRVLFVDDNDEARTMVSTVLAAAGARVSVATSALEALSLLDTDHVDVVLTDLGMPHVDGYDFLMRLRERERADGREPVCVIALTAYAGGEDRRRALACGFQGHLAKPVDPGDLVRAIRDALAEARGQERD